MNVLCLLLAVAMSAGNAEFEKTAAVGAAEVVVERAKRELVRTGPAAGLLERAMLAEPDACVKRADAETVCRAKYEAALDAALAAKVAEVKERLGLDSVAGETFDDAGRESAMRNFADAFERERAQACDAQAKKISARVKPAEADIGVRSEDDLRSELVAKVIAQQRTAVFEENAKYVSEAIVEPILASARDELKHQREHLARARCDAYAPSALAKELEENLTRHVEARKAKAKDPSLAWDVFPVVVREAVPAMAERRTLERVARCIDDVAVTVDAETLSARIAADRKVHRRAGDSENVFRAEFARQVAEGATAKVIAEAPAPEREEFAAYVRNHAGAESLAKAVDSRVRRDLMPKLRLVRAELAEKDARAVWPDLMDGAWFPEPELADDFAARSDYAKAVRSWRQSPSLAALAKAAGDKVLLEESDRIADVKVAKAFELARSAINAQNAILGEIGPGVLSDVKGRKDQWFSKTPDFKSVVEMLTSSVTEKWDETRETVLWGNDPKPQNARDQHHALFPSVQKRIELVARSILEEVNKPEEEKQEHAPEAKPTPEEPPKPEEPPPEEPPPETPPEEQPPEAPLFVISVQREGDSVDVKLLEGKKALVERKARADLGDFRSAMKELSEKLGTEILKLQ